jgi:hypothetical protein
MAIRSVIFFVCTWQKLTENNTHFGGKSEFQSIPPLASAESRMLAGCFLSFQPVRNFTATFAGRRTMARLRCPGFCLRGNPRIPNS